MCAEATPSRSRHSPRLRFPVARHFLAALSAGGPCATRGRCGPAQKRHREHARPQHERSDRDPAPRRRPHPAPASTARLGSVGFRDTRWNILAHLSPVPPGVCEGPASAYNAGSFRVRTAGSGCCCTMPAAMWLETEPSRDEAAQLHPGRARGVICFRRTTGAAKTSIHSQTGAQRRSRGRRPPAGLRPPPPEPACRRQRIDPYGACSCVFRASRWALALEAPAGPSDANPASGQIYPRDGAIHYSSPKKDVF